MHNPEHFELAQLKHGQLYLPTPVARELRGESAQVGALSPWNQRAEHFEVAAQQELSGLPEAHGLGSLRAPEKPLSAEEQREQAREKIARQVVITSIKEPQATQLPAISVVPSPPHTQKKQTTLSRPTEVTQAVLEQRPIQRRSRRARYAAHALDLKDDEIVREPGNNGHEIDSVYRANNQRVRQLFVEKAVNGTLYGSTRQFVGELMAAHRFAGGSDVYKRVGGGSMGLVARQLGEIRDYNVDNGRRGQARDVAMIAEALNDPYKERFQREGRYTLRLPGVTSYPSDVIQDGRYKFYYPDAKGLPSYMKMARKVGVEIEKTLSQPTVNQAQAVDLIARQYQYLACARPFRQINNSVFMNLANAQLKLAGLEGIAHHELDLAAQRLQPDTFAKLFTRLVKAGQ